MAFETVKVSVERDVATVMMNRPERRNAFNSMMVNDLTQAFQDLETSEVRSIVLTGDGAAFSAGADLEYMREIREAGKKENYADAMRLATLLELIYSHPKPVIALVNGPAIGGGLGLISACDIAVAANDAFFAFSEVRLGLIPAVIGPYVVKRISERHARRYMLTGDRFDATMALDIGLVNDVVLKEDLDDAVADLTESFSQCAPCAVTACKKMVRRVGEEPLASVKEWTAELIANLRAGEEGQEGMTAFLEKRRPGWLPEN